MNKVCISSEGEKGCNERNKCSNCLRNVVYLIKTQTLSVFECGNVERG